METPNSQNSPSEYVIPESEIFSAHIKMWVILADGSHYNGQVYKTNRNPHQLEITINEKVSIVDLVQVFTNSEKTQTIKNQIVDTDPLTVYTGYIHLVGIRTNEDGTATITLSNE